MSAADPSAIGAAPASGGDGARLLGREDLTVRMKAFTMIVGAELEDAVRRLGVAGAAELLKIAVERAGLVATELRLVKVDRAP